MADQKDEQLGRVMAAQTRAAGRTALFAQRADKAPASGLAAFWRAVSASRRVQAGRMERLLRGKIPPDLDGARAAYDEESAELRRSLAAAAGVARDQDAAIAAQALEQCGQVEARADELYPLSAESGADAPAGYLVCQVCGYMAQGRPPDRCPVCGAVPEKFSPVE